MKIAIVGLGLIGGSFAKAIKKHTSDEIAGLDKSEEVLGKALDCGAIDEAVSAIPCDTDMTLVALYPEAAVEFIREHKTEIPTGSMLIDLCGVKRHICGTIEEELTERGVVFIGGHPMAGREYFGFEASSADLFEGASMILTPTERVQRSQCLLAELFFLRLGFGGITYTTPEEHDEIIALTSQLAHVVSSAYVQCPVSTRYMGFSAGSFHDMTRVAKLHEGMWTELFMLNSDYLSEQIGVLIEKLTAYKNAISGGAREDLYQLLKSGREIKEAINEKKR